jgi:hypothetical protein
MKFYETEYSLFMDAYFAMREHLLGGIDRCNPRKSTCWLATQLADIFKKVFPHSLG